MLKGFSYNILILYAVLLGLAPFYPEPHLVQKFKMLMAGTLHKPLDIFDIFFHSFPILLIAIKYFSEKRDKAD